MANYVRFDERDVEPPISDESELQGEIRDLITRVQGHNFAAHRHGKRGTHVKTQGIVKGEFRVKQSLPTHLARGLCGSENAGSPHPCAMRFANEPSLLTDDRTGGPRGVGIRIFNVQGKHMDSIGDDTATQDLTLNNAPILELRDLPTCVEIFRIREKNFFQPDKIADQVSKRDDKDLQLAPSRLPNRHFLSYTMYSQSAYRWGDAVCKYAIFPSQSMLESLQREVGRRNKSNNKSDDGSDGLDVTEHSDREQHSKWLQEWFQAHDAEYDLRVQLCQDLSAQPVEDSSVEWDEQKYPFETVGSIHIPKGQDCFSSARRNFWDDHMKLNVWYGLEDYRPLGSVNRLRKQLYKVSAANREDMNAVKVRDVANVDEIPN